MDNIEIFSKNKKEETVGEVYEIPCNGGYGNIYKIEIMDGVEVSYNDFSTMEAPIMEGFINSNILEINHCLKGKFECNIENKYYTYVQEGDMSINLLNIERGPSTFPLSYYYGVEILIDIEKTKDNFLFQFLNIDINKITDNLKKNEKYFIIRSTEQLQHVFMEMYSRGKNVNVDYLKIKVAELLLFIQNTTFSKNHERRNIYNKDKIDKIKYIRETLEKRLNRNIDIKKVSKEFDINPSTLRKYFKDIYGIPLYTWHRNLRLQFAKEMLKNTDIPVIEIAAKIGYENPSKFSDSFYKYTKFKPLEYRQKTK